MGFEGQFAVNVSFSEAPKKPEAPEQSEWYGLDQERVDRFDYLLNGKGLSLDMFQDRQELAVEYPEDYPAYDQGRAETLLADLKSLDAKGDDFKTAVEALISMLK